MVLRIFLLFALFCVGIMIAGGIAAFRADYLPDSTLATQLAAIAIWGSATIMSGVFLLCRKANGTLAITTLGAASVHVLPWALDSQWKDIAVPLLVIIIAVVIALDVVAIKARAEPTPARIGGGPGGGGGGGG